MQESIFKILGPTFNKINTLVETKIAYLSNEKFSINRCDTGIKFDSGLLSLSFAYRFSQEKRNAFCSDLSDTLIEINETVYKLNKLSLKTANFPLLKDTNTIVIDEIYDACNLKETKSFIRLIVPHNSQKGKIELVQGFKDLKTDADILYGTAWNSICIEGITFDYFRCSNKKKEDFYIIESQQRINQFDFRRFSMSLIKTFCFLFNPDFSEYAYIVTSNDDKFSAIETISLIPLKNKFHDLPIYKSMEIRSYKYHKSIFIFPKETLTCICERILNNEKFSRSIDIVIEANNNNNALSKSVLYSTAIETLKNLTPKGKAKKPIDDKRFEENKIVSKLTDVINSSNLTDNEKKYIVERKLTYINSPTNIDRLKNALNTYWVDMPDKFIDVLKYRDTYFHGSIPKDKPIEANSERLNMYRAFQLLFISHLLVLKLCGYKGFLKDYSILIDYYNQKNNSDEENIIINNPLYYKI